MKSKSFFFAGFVCILLSVSCKKESSQNNNNGNHPKSYTEDVQSTFIGNSNITYTLTYDGNNRITSIISNSTPQQRSMFEYKADNTYSFDLFEDNELQIHEKFWIGPLSLLDSTYQYNNTGDTSTEKYIYNSSSQLSQLREFDFSTTGGSQVSNITDYVYNSDGNPVTETDYNHTITYDYTDFLYGPDLGLIYIFKPKNLAKNVTYNNGGSSETVTHTYTFDDKNRLSTDKMVTSYGDTYTRTFNY